MGSLKAGQSVLSESVSEAGDKGGGGGGEWVGVAVGFHTALINLASIVLPQCPLITGPPCRQMQEDTPGLS